MSPAAILLDDHGPPACADVVAWAKHHGIPTVLDAGSLHDGTRVLWKEVAYVVASERFAKELAAEMPSVDAYFGSHHLEQVVRELGVDFRAELLGERRLTTLLPLEQGMSKSNAVCVMVS